MRHLAYILGFSLLFILLTPIAKGQSVSKDTTIIFSGENRDISIYIPSDYSSSTPAKLLIGLHGSGDNCKNYISALKYLFPESSMPNTVIICPDGGNDLSRDFYTPVGDEVIIDTMIAFAMNNFNIDPSQIVLQGFSLGGRSALRYGLTYSEKFKALLLNTPAVQGVKEAVRQYSEGGLFQYENAAEIPIYITCGNQDLNYAAPIDSMNLQLILNDGKVHYRQFSMGHSIPFMSEMSDFYQFIESLYISDYDLDVVKIDVPLRSCETSVPFSVIVQNKGKETLTDIRFRYNAGGSSSQYSWTGNLPPFQHLKIDFPNITISSGNYTLTVEVDALNGSFTDTINYNNSADARFDVSIQSKMLPYIESFASADFEKFSNEWLLISSGDYYTSMDYDPSGGMLYCFNTIWIFDNSGRKEELVSPLLDLSSISNPSIAFDVAYLYTIYTLLFTDSTTADVAFADTLEVLISTDCGETYTSLYKKGGDDLLTFDNPLTNVSLNTLLYTSPKSNDWRREWIDLSSYAENTSAIIKFSYISALGGLIFLDNIAFSDEKVHVKDAEFGEVLIFPNPVQDILTINLAEYKLKSANLYDISGRKIKDYHFSGESSVEIYTKEFSAGFYLIELNTDCGKRIMKKIVVQR